MSVSSAVLLACLASAALGCEQTVVLDRATDSGRPSDANAGSGGGAGAADAASNGADTHCSGSAQQLPFTVEAAVALVALDRSSAMSTTEFGPGDTLTHLGAALDALSALVQKNEPDQNGRPLPERLLHFAFLDFPDSATDCSAAPGCCSSDVTVTPTYESFNMVEMVAAAPCAGENTCIESSDRPTAAALRAASNFFQQATNLPAGARYVLLVTDGAPSGGCNPNSDCSAAIQAIEPLQHSDVETVIVEVGDDSNDSCLLDLANAEGSPQPPYYYAAPSSDALPNTLSLATETIARSACHFDLNAAPANAGEVSVSYQNAPVPRDATNGWEFDSGSTTRINLFGSACDDLVRSGTGSFAVVEGCLGRFGP